MHSGTYLRISPDLELYFEEAGTGSPIIFIPGWAGTTEFYTHQLAHFAKHYRAITFDPRSVQELAARFEGTIVETEEDASPGDTRLPLFAMTALNDALRVPKIRLNRQRVIAAKKERIR